MDTPQFQPAAALATFAGTYLVVALGRLPGFRIDRTGAAIIGASMMVAFKVLTFEEAVAAVDAPTLALLFGMMIVVANLRLSGFFRLVAAWAVRRAHRPATLLAAIIGITGVFSALFVNDTMCLVMTPLVLEVTAALGLNPIPYLLGVAMAANAGSTATITGNPQNMMIGSLSRIPYRDFTLALAPVAAFALIATFWVLAVAYRQDLRHKGGDVDPSALRVRVNKVLLWKALVVSIAMIACFLSGLPVATVAIVAGAVLLVTRRVKPEKVYHEIDFSLLVLFAGLFVVIAGLEKVLAQGSLLQNAAGSNLQNTGVLTTLSAVLSNVVSNVPAVLIFRPLVAYLPDARHAWLTLAMSSTLAGNLTIVGSVANLIVVQRARREAHISFWEYFKTGAPLTVITLAFGTVWLAWLR